jgi:hypothetical protein
MPRLTYAEVQAATDAVVVAAVAALADLATARTDVTDLLATLLEQLEAERSDPELHAENCKSVALTQQTDNRFPVVAGQRFTV